MVTFAPILYGLSLELNVSEGKLLKGNRCRFSRSRLSRFITICKMYTAKVNVKAKMGRFD